MRFLSATRALRQNVVGAFFIGAIGVAALSWTGCDLGTYESRAGAPVPDLSEDAAGSDSETDSTEDASE